MVTTMKRGAKWRLDYDSVGYARKPRDPYWLILKERWLTYESYGRDTAIM